MAFLFRFKGRLSDFNEKKTLEIDGVTYFYKFDKHKKDNIEHRTATYFGFEINSNAMFDITEESRWDVVFKKIGFSEEFQTGDQLFDKHFYISSDNAAVKRLLQSEEIIRAEMMNLFTEGCLKIFCSRSILWFKVNGDKAFNKEMVILCNSLQSKISESLNHLRHLKSDPFEFKTFLIEGIIYSIAMYSIAGFVEFGSFEGDIHLNPFLLVRPGIIVGASVAIFLIAMIYLLMKGSSRSHRIIVESAIVLGISLPLGGYIAVSDVNTKLDRTEAQIVYAKVESVYRKVHRSRRRTSYSYHMNIITQNEPIEINIPTHIQISKSLFSQLSAGSVVKMKVKRGYLQAPWFEDISPK